MEKYEGRSAGLNKRGFVCLTFLGCLLVISALCALLFEQLAVRMEVSRQLQLSDHRDQRIILALRWVRAQLLQQARCEGMQQPGWVRWQGDVVHVDTGQEIIIMDTNENCRCVTDYTVQGGGSE